MPSILLIRHGQASYAAADYDVLSETGVRQAALTREAFAFVQPSRVVSGGLRRQRDSAVPWGEAVVDPRWNEYDAADVLGAHGPSTSSLEHPVGPDGEPLSSRDFQALLDRALLDWIAAGPESGARETWTTFRGRVSAAAAELAGALGSGESAVVLTSGGVIGALAAWALGLPDSTMPAFNHVAVNGAVTKLVSGRRGVSLISYNEHCHLEAHGLVTYR